MSLLLGELHCRQTLAVGCADVGALRDERLERVEIVVGRREMQRPPAAAVGGVHIGAVPDEQARHHFLVRGKRGVQRCIRGGVRRSCGRVCAVGQ